MMFDYASKLDIIDRKHNEGLKVGKYTPKKVKNRFTDEEEKKLIEIADTIHFADVPVILLYTGLRVMELMNAKTENVHLEERYLIAGSKTSAGKSRVIPINRKILPYITKYYNQGNEYLITSPKGKQFTYSKYIRECWEPLMEQLQLNHTPHETRYTTASKLDDAKLIKW